MPKFIVQFQGQESVAELKPGANSVGRQSTCSIPLKDSTLSRLHCEVILAGSVATLLDKGSRNGTLLNGKKIEAQVLQPGDKIQIGATTLWYEKKNVANEAAKPAPAAAPAPSTRRATGPIPQSDTGVRRAPTAAVRPAAPAPPSAAAEAAGSRLEDYSFHGKAGGNVGKIVAAVLLVAALGVGAWFAKGLLSTTTVAVDDSANYVARNAHFDLVTGGKPDSWAMRPSILGDKSSCSASVDASRGRNNSPGLVMEKSAGAADLVAECGFQDDLAIPRGSGLSASAWTSFENFNGWAALKIDWLKSARGAVIAEEFSDPVKASGWTEIRAAFNPPAGAGAFRVALAIVGRGGRVYFDDVSIKAVAGAPAGPDKKIGPHHKVAYAKNGLLQLDLRGGRRTLANIGLRLESEKEGAVPQAFSTDVTAKSEAEGLAFEGKMVNPLDFRDLFFEERVGQNEGLTNVVYQFRGDALKQVDRVTIALTLPRVDGPPRGIPEDGAPTDSITCNSEDGEFVIEYAEPAVVKVKNVDGRLRITQTWKVDPQAEDPAFIFRIREQQGDVPVNAWEALVDLKGRRQNGKALALGRAHVKSVKDAAAREKFDAEIKNLEDAERRDWAEAQAQTFQARISRRSDLVSKAVDSLGAFGKSWSGEGTEAKADQLRRELEKELASTPAGDAERPRRIFERAKKYMELGRRSLARSMLQTLLQRYPSSDVTAPAQDLLKTLSE